MPVCSNYAKNYASIIYKGLESYGVKYDLRGCYRIVDGRPRKHEHVIFFGVKTGHNLCGCKNGKTLIEVYLI